MEVEGYSFFALNVPLHGRDLLDNYIGRLHTNFQMSATLSKKVLIFFSINLSTPTSTFKVEVEVDTIWGKIRNF